MAFVGIARGAFLVNRPQAVYFLQSSEMRHTHLAVVKIRFEMLHFKKACKLWLYHPIIYYLGLDACL